MKYFIFTLLLLSETVISQISTALQQQFARNEIAPVLIELKEQADLSGIEDSWSKKQKAVYVFEKLKRNASVTQEELLRYLDLHQIHYRSFYIVNAVWAEVNQQQAYDIAAFPFVKNISYDSYSASIPARDLTSSLVSRAPEITWGIKRVRADKVWEKGIEGQGVVVAGNDTGIKWDISAIKDRYRGYKNNSIDHNYNWHDAIHQNSPLSDTSSPNPCGYNLREPCDDNSHGTHTVGTMVGLTHEHAIGMAPKAEYIGCRNMERGNGAPSTYIECFEFFLAPYDLDGLNPKPELAPHVINNSWYCSREEGCDPTNFSLMELVVENLRTSGVVVVVSAGNDGVYCSSLRHVPAIFKNSFSVGSIAPNDTISGFSSNGPVINYKDVIIKPNVVAPGSQVLSMLPNESYAAWNGTSMAGPHVAGLVALMISANPAIAGQVDKIENIIEETAERFTGFFDCTPFSAISIPNNTYGFGLINAEAAVDAAKQWVASNDATLNGLKLFPNPSSDEITIESNITGNTLISIKNALGSKLIETEIQNGHTLLNISHLIPGVYFLCEERNGKKYTLVKL